jgi:phytanoyl-CoA hydroxylase
VLASFRSSENLVQLNTFPNSKRVRMAIETPLSEKPTIDGVPLYVNDGLLAPDEVKPLRPSYPSEPLEELCKRYAEDGYVFLKGLLPREDVNSARGCYFQRLQPCGVIDPDSDPREGIFNASGAVADYPGVGVEAGSGAPATSNEELFTELALKAHTDEWYIGSPDGKVPGLVNHPKLLQFVADFTGWGDKTLAIRRTLLRNNTPGNKAIGVHYDQIFLRHGEPSVLTAWVPIGDIALDGGGLIYLQDGGFCSVDKNVSFALAGADEKGGKKSRRPARSTNRKRVCRQSHGGWS